MRHLLTAGFAVLVLAAPAAARVVEPSPADPPAARVGSCDVTGADRSATFVGRMEAIPGTTRMSMRFTLLERLGRGEWGKVDIADLKPARRSQPGVKTFSWRQKVTDLRTGGAYRAQIQYRWIGPAGTVLRTVMRQTPVCRGPFANLRVDALDVRPGPTPETSVYRATVTNAGKGDADEVEVRLSVDRALLDATTIDELQAGESRVVSFTGPACRNAVQVRIDPDNSIGESSEEDNLGIFSCRD